MMRSLVFALLMGLIGFVCSVHAQKLPPSDRLTLAIASIQKNEFGILISVDIANNSQSAVYLPQASSWPDFRQLPRVASLDVEQWSDGKTNLSPIGEKLLEVHPGNRYYSLGPCRDAVSRVGWVRLDPGKHVSDKIQAFDPTKAEGNSVCPMKFAHFADKLRISVVAFPFAHAREKQAINASTEFAIPEH